MLRHIFLWVFVYICVLGYSSPVFSEDNEIVEEIIVTATHRETELMQTPQAISAVTGEMIEELGVTDTIPSPTYTLCETYTINRTQVISHMDLYRLQDPEELEFLGFREMLDGHGVLIEWPERAASFLPSPDLDLHLMWDGDRRICALAAKSEKGEYWLSNLEVPNAA